MKDVQCHELFGGIALKNHAFSFFHLSRPTDWSKVFVDFINVVFCRPLGLVTGFNAICNDCLAGVPSSSLKMCPVNLSQF